QLTYKLVSNGPEVVVRDLVIRITIAAGEREILDERMIDDRDLNFAEQLANVEAARFAAVRRAIYRQCRSTVAGDVVYNQCLVGLRQQRLLAILSADVQRHAAVRPRRLEAIFAAFEGEIGVGYGLVDATRQ